MEHLPYVPIRTTKICRRFQNNLLITILISTLTEIKVNHFDWLLQDPGLSGPPGLSAP